MIYYVSAIIVVLGAIVASVLRIEEMRNILLIPLFCGCIIVVIGIIAFIVNSVGFLAFDAEFSAKPLWAIGLGVVLLAISSLLYGIGDALEKYTWWEGAFIGGFWFLGMIVAFFIIYAPFKENLTKFFNYAWENFSNLFQL